MISSEKQTLRLRVAETLRAMPVAERSERSARIANHLAAKLGESPGLVFGFAPMRQEPAWIPAVTGRWTMAFPRIEGTTLQFYRAASPADLVPGAFGTKEPAGGERCELGAASVILIPGVAFDRQGGRLGRGGGFYDRVLADPVFTARRIALCFACQLVDLVPSEAHDARMDGIVTEDGWIAAHSSGFDPD